MLTLEVPPISRFALLTRLAQRYRKTVTFLDLETTTFLDQPTFGITEIGLVHVEADGRVWNEGGLVNPENPINPKVIELNGITNEMVAGEAPFKAWIERMREIAEVHLVIGFNSRTFDIPGTIAEAKRYGGRLEFKDAIDLRDRYIELLRPASRRGKLADVARIFDVEVPVGIHRGVVDARLTAEVTEAFLEHYGFTGLLDRALHGPVPATSTATTATQDAAPTPRPPAERGRRDGLVISQRDRAIIASVKSEGYDPARIATQYGVSVDRAAGICWDACGRGELALDSIAEPTVQAWLAQQGIDVLAKRIWSNPDLKGRLKPIFEALTALPDCPTLDYTQIRVARALIGF